ncbi:MAG: hypothetical protein SGCHY_002047 [Lobulomycetales sp.]
MNLSATFSVATVLAILLSTPTVVEAKLRGRYLSQNNIIGGPGTIAGNTIVANQGRGCSQGVVYLSGPKKSGSNGNGLQKQENSRGQSKKSIRQLQKSQNLMFQSSLVNGDGAGGGEDSISSALPSFASRRAAPQSRAGSVAQAGASSNSVTNSRPPTSGSSAPPADYKPRMDFATLPKISLERYQKLHLSETPASATHNEVVDQANAKFQKTSIDEKESISYFIYKCKNSGIRPPILLIVREDAALTLPDSFVSLSG